MNNPDFHVTKACGNTTNVNVKFKSKMNGA